MEPEPQPPRRSSTRLAEKQQRLSEAPSEAKAERPKKKAKADAAPADSAPSDAPVAEAKRKSRSTGTALKPKPSQVAEDAAEETPAEPAEERLEKYQRKPPTGFAARLQRALQQRLYLISRSDVGPLEKKFVVLGSIGNVYDVVISHRPTCNCPDFGKGYLCKHLLFVFLRVLRVDRRSVWIYQKALLSEELREMFATAPPAPAAVLACKKVVKRYNEIKSGKDETPQNDEDDADDGAAVKRRPLADDCPVCYEELKASEATVWCKASCGNSVHTDCFDRWALSKKRGGEQVSCVWCRAEWLVEEKRDPHGNLEEREGYLNLGAHQPDHPGYRPDWGWRRGSF
eukprot:TRINITY_DN4270_c0_g1_i2.p1 TRINITY_DN4270_c0_g1~~TRINITY_DN4270_c0_g1_i2.p1  ORF type:complete len:343 (-),score=103.64 TRINITY_DN4270_c0_g1_i2:261-1289(-)